MTRVLFQESKMAVVTNPTIDAKTRGIIVHIVEKIKSQGVFDKFRRDCLEELDSKEPYRQLKQRVESHVATFLSKQVCSPSLPKNQLRNSLRANISQSEVLSKGVDRLLEQVLVEKSGSFYGEIEGLVHDYLSSIGHYRKIEREKHPKVEMSKLSDKEIDDFIKEETTKFLEATAEEEKMKEKAASSMSESVSNSERKATTSTSETPSNGKATNPTSEASSSSEGKLENSMLDSTANSEDKSTNLTSEALSNNEEMATPSTSKALSNSSNKIGVTTTDAEETTKSPEQEPDDDITVPKTSKTSDIIISDDTPKPRSENNKDVDKNSTENENSDVDKCESVVSEVKNDASVESVAKDLEGEVQSAAAEVQEKMEKAETESVAKGEGAEFTENVATEMLEAEIASVALAKEELLCKPVSSPTAQPTSTDEETDDDVDLEILAKPNFTETKSEVSEIDISDLSDSDITVSSVHTSDLSSLSDLEFEDFEEMSKKSIPEATDTSEALVTVSKIDADAVMDDSDFGNARSGNTRQFRRISSTEPESENSDTIPQRRSARVASKDRVTIEERDEEPEVYAKELDQPEKNEESRKRVRKKQREVFEEKKHQLTDARMEVGGERALKREQRMTSDSNESEDLKQSKRSKRTIRPTRCYSPSDNN